MPIEYYLIQAVVGFGLTFLIKDSLILAKPRTWLASKSKFISDLLHCSFCTGIWVGVFLSLISFLAWPYTGIRLALVRVLYVTIVVAVSAYYLDLKTRIMENEADNE